MNGAAKAFMKRCAWTLLIIFSIRCAVSWGEICVDFSLYLLFGFAGEAISVTAILGAIYEKILWKYDSFLKWPVLYGTYEGVIKPNCDNRERKIDVQVKQTLFSVHVILKSEESKSKAFTADINERDGEYILCYSYLNRPNAEVRDRSEIHYGTAILSISDKSHRLEGEYYTDRKTTGDMMLWAIEKSKTKRNN